MPAYVEIMVPWVPGPDGFGLPSDRKAVDRAVDVVAALLELDPAGLFIEHPSRTPLAAVDSLDYGVRKASGLRAIIANALLEPRMLDGEPVARIWVANGCTITTVHPFNEHAGGELAIMMMMPVELNQAIATLVNEDRGGVEMKPEGRGFRAMIDSLVMCAWPMSGRDAVDHCDLYAPTSLERPVRWVSSVGRNTFGVGVTIYASALPLRPASGGFLEYFTRTVTSIRSWTAFTQAFRRQPVRALIGWFITRTSALEGWVAVPLAVARGSHADLLEYLQSPESLDAGWVDVHQRVFSDRASNGLYGWIRADKYGVSVVNTVKAFAGALPVTIEVAEVRANGLPPFPWVRLTARGSAGKRGTDIWMGHEPTGTVRIRRRKNSRSDSRR